MFIVSKALPISRATVILHAGGTIRLNPLATVLFIVCSSVFAITERRDVGLYEVPLSMSGFRMGTMLANTVMYGIMLVLRAVFKMIVRNAIPRGYMCFMCLMFSLSGPCELLFLLCFIASWAWVVVSVMLYLCILCVALLMDLKVLCVACLAVFVNCVQSAFL